jgi:signal transduction histidine kinase
VRPEQATGDDGSVLRSTEHVVARSAADLVADREPDAAVFDLRLLIEETAAPLAAAALGKGLLLEVKTAASLPARVVGDAACVRQVLFALLENAVESTETGEVVASVTSQESGSGRILVHFEISDTGPGMPPEGLDGAGGGGIERSRRLVELMDGRMECSSAPGLGSTLSFSVPLDLCD